MKNRKADKILKYIVLTPIVSLVLLSFSILLLVNNMQEQHLQEDILEIKKAYDITHKGDHQSHEHKDIKDIKDIVKDKITHTKQHFQEQNELLILFSFIITFIVILVTIYISKNISKSLQYTNQALQQKVDEQTIELQMVIANKTIQNISQTKQYEEEQLKAIKFTAIGQMAAGMTHEINTPLTYIKGNFEMMQYDIEDLESSDIKTRMQEDSVKIIDGINRLTNIVESMREMSQKSKESKEKVNIYHTLVTSLTLLYNRSKQISNVRLNGELFEIGIDNEKEYYASFVQKQRIEQVWVIILNNALDELVKKDIFEDRILDINIKCDDTNSEVIVKIKDNAGGIPISIIDNIFDPFISTKESSGMGVGLNVAKKIVDEQNGKIVAYNEEDGAVFEVRIACSECQA